MLTNFDSTYLEEVLWLIYWEQLMCYQTMEKHYFLIIWILEIITLEKTLNRTIAGNENKYFTTLIEFLWSLKIYFHISSTRSSTWTIFVFCESKKNGSKNQVWKIQLLLKHQNRWTETYFVAFNGDTSYFFQKKLIRDIFKLSLTSINYGR